MSRLCLNPVTPRMVGNRICQLDLSICQFPTVSHWVINLRCLEGPLLLRDPITLPSVRKLTINGLQSTASRLMALRLPSLGTLEVDVDPKAPWPDQRRVWIRKLQDLLPTVHTIILRNINFGNQYEFRALLDGGL